MSSRIKATMQMDCTSVAIKETLLDIAIPEGSVFELLSCAVYLGRSTSGTTVPGELFAGIVAKPTGLSALSNADIAPSTEFIGISGLINDMTAGSGGINVAGNRFLDVAPNPYALTPYVIMGIDATGAGDPVFELLYIIDYQIIKMTQQIAVSLAQR